MTLSDEQAALADTVRTALTKPAADGELWQRLASEIGLGALGLPPDRGGVGGLFEVVLVMEEIGRALTDVPFFSSTVLAAPLLAETEPDVGIGSLLDALLDDLAEGRRTAAIAFDAEQTLRIEPSGGAGSAHIYGRAENVIDGMSADAVVLCCRNDGKDTLVLVEQEDGTAREPVRLLDPDRQLAHLTFDAAPGRVLQQGGNARAALDRARDRAAVALAAESVGIAAQVLDLTVTYVKQRRQFGRPVGEFQAVRHACAEMLVSVETARALVRQVALAADRRQLIDPVAGSAALHYCSGVARSVSSMGIHLHGGIGFTWDSPLHRYFKRANSLRNLPTPMDSQHTRLRDALVR